MGEQEPNDELELEAKCQKIKELIISQWHFSDAEWAEIYLEAAAAEGFVITEANDTPIHLPESITPVEFKEAIFMALYGIYVYGDTEVDPLGLIEEK